MSDPYAQISKSKLSFKNDKLKPKKKKKKSKDEEKDLDDKKIDLIKDAKLAEELIKIKNKEKLDKELLDKLSSKFEAPKLTAAEIAFRDKQEKMQAERVLKKAAKTHKQRVEEFNAHLNSLSEHYECAKVSWTK